MKLITEKDEDYSLYHELNFQLTFEGIIKHKKILSSIQNDLQSLINVSSSLEQGSAARILQQDVEFITEIKNLEEGPKSPKIILRILKINSQSLGSTVKIRVEPKKLEWTNPTDSTDKIYWSEEPSFYDHKLTEKVSKEDLKSMAEVSSFMDNNKENLQLVSSVAIGLTLVSAGAPSGAVINMIKFFKLFFRFRLINQFFGKLLEAFTVILGQNFSKSYEIKNLKDHEKMMFMDTRGKLTLHKIPIFANFIIGTTLIIYFVKFIIFFLNLTYVLAVKNIISTNPQTQKVHRQSAKTRHL